MLRAILVLAVLSAVTATPAPDEPQLTTAKSETAGERKGRCSWQVTLPDDYNEPTDSKPYEFIPIDHFFTYTDTDGNKKVGDGCAPAYRNLTASALTSNESGEKLVRFRKSYDVVDWQFECHFRDAQNLATYVLYKVDEEGFVVSAHLSKLSKCKELHLEITRVVGGGGGGYLSPEVVATLLG